MAAALVGVLTVSVTLVPKKVRCQRFDVDKYRIIKSFAKLNSHSHFKPSNQKTANNYVKNTVIFSNKKILYRLVK